VKVPAPEDAPHLGQKKKSSLPIGEDQKPAPAALKRLG
jgi:hypothetical protein